MTPFEKLAGRLQGNLADFTEALETFVAAVPLSTAWIEREWPLAAHNQAKGLLTAAKIALLETGTAWAIGSNRGAAASMRAYVENAFGWLFYKDHPVEFAAVQNGLLDLSLPKAVQAYIKSVDAGFDDAYRMLAKYAERTNEYYYSDISHFVHAHPSIVGLSKNIEDIAVASPRDSGFLAISKMTDEFISDNFLSHYRGSWDTVPKAVQANAATRLDTKLGKFLGKA